MPCSHNANTVRRQEPFLLLHCAIINPEMSLFVGNIFFMCAAYTIFLRGLLGEPQPISNPGILFYSDCCDI